jgi:nitrate reductase gamma subunit
MNGLAKLAYKPVGMAFSVLGGILAGALFGQIWKRVSDSDSAPDATDDDHSTREVLLAALLQGAVFGLVKAAVDRAGMKGVKKFLESDRPNVRST